MTHATRQRDNAPRTGKRGERKRSRDTGDDKKRKDPIAALHRTVGNQAVKELAASQELRSKGSVRHREDRIEHEIGRVSRAETRTREPNATGSTDTTSQRRTTPDTAARDDDPSAGGRSPNPPPSDRHRWIRRYRVQEHRPDAGWNRSVEADLESNREQPVEGTRTQTTRQAAPGVGPIRHPTTPSIQPKLREIQHDRYEREADRVAALIVWNPHFKGSTTGTHSDSPSNNRLIHRDRVPVGRHPPPADGRQQRVRHDANAMWDPSLQSPMGDVAPELRSQTGSGRPLPASILSVLGPQFGVDLSTVRVHSGTQAANLTRALNAHAFAYGRHIYFGRGCYDVTTAAGRDLLAHELTHVVQQRSVPRSARGDPPPQMRASRLSADTVEATVRYDDALGSAASTNPARLGRPAVQRRPLPDLKDTRLGSIGFELPGGGLFRGDIRVESELTPPGRDPGRFEGYTDRLLAVARCWREDALCAVFEDDSGRYHAMKTNWPARDPRVEGLHLSPAEGIRGLQWVHVTDEAAARAAEEADGGRHRSWGDRVQQVKRWHDAWTAGTVPPDFQPNDGQRTRQALREAIERGYVSLLAEVLGIGRNEIHVARSADDWEPRRINFDLTLTVRGRGGIGSLPEDRETDNLPEPTVVIGPKAIEAETRLSALATAIHEATHYAHGERTLELWNRWRRSRLHLTFVEWLRRRRSRKDDPEEEILAEETVRVGKSNTEALARMQAFVSTYHRFELDDTRTRFISIDMLPNYWSGTDSAVKTNIIRRLATYVDSLPDKYRQDLVRHMNEKLEAAEQDQLLRAHVRFWERFAREIF